MVVQNIIPTPHIWTIVKILVSTLAPFVLNCVLNQHHGYWLLSNALNAFNLCVKSINERLKQEIWMNFIPPFQFDVELLLWISKMQLKITWVLVPFLNCLYQFYPKKTHMMLAIMFDPTFKDIFILSNYVRIGKITTATTRYNFETLIPLLCLSLSKSLSFCRTPIKF